MTNSISVSQVGNALSIGAFLQAYPIGKVKTILKKTGKSSKRERVLPNYVLVYYVLALALFMNDSYREVMRTLLEGFRYCGRKKDAVRPLSKSGISQARTRLGFEPLQQMFEEFVRPIAIRTTVGARYKRWLVVSLDGSTMDVADTAENDKEFGRPKGSRGSSAFPKIRFVTLMENGTRVLFGAALGAYGGSNAVSEMELARQVIDNLRKGMLCLADRYYLGYEFFKAACETGADHLWRAKRYIILTPVKRLSDGSYLSYLYRSAADRKKGRNGILVRVIEYKFKWVRHGEPYIRLITTILNPEEALAVELAALYHERWEVETGLGELKIDLRGADIILRSKTPNLVRQEFYALLLAHFAVRGVMHEAALKAKEDPDRLSFLHSVNVLRRKVAVYGSRSKRRWSGIHQATIDEILEERVEQKRHRRNHRGVKRKMSNYPLAKRSLDRQWRTEPATIISILRSTPKKTA